MSVKVTREMVRKVAQLSALDIDDSEVDEFCKRFEAILDHVRELEKIDISTMSELNLMDRPEVFRADEPVQELELEEVLANAPARGRNSFRIPRVVGGE